MVNSKSTFEQVAKSKMPFAVVNGEMSFCFIEGGKYWVRFKNEYGFETTKVVRFSK